MRRGRPRLLSNETEQFWRTTVDIRPDATTRTVQNSTYLGRALSVLGGAVVSQESAVRWNWLLRPTASGVPHPRNSIMYQLGRTRHEGTLKLFADEICKIKPSAQKAILILREWQGRFSGSVAAHIVANEEITDDLLNTIALRIVKHRPS